jgi:hypothetical protein
MTNAERNAENRRTEIDDPDEMLGSIFSLHAGRWRNIKRRDAA